MERFRTLPRVLPVDLIFFGMTKKFGDTRCQRVGRFAFGDQAGFTMDRRFNQTIDWIDDRWSAHRVGFDDVQPPAFPLRGVKQQMRAPEQFIFATIGKVNLVKDS